MICVRLGMFMNVENLKYGHILGGLLVFEIFIIMLLPVWLMFFQVYYCQLLEFIATQSMEFFAAELSAQVLRAKLKAHVLSTVSFFISCLNAPILQLMLCIPIFQFLKKNFLYIELYSGYHAKFSDLILRIHNILITLWFLLCC